MGTASPFRIFDLSVICVSVLSRVMEAKTAQIRWEPLLGIAQRALRHSTAHGLPNEFVTPLAMELTMLASRYTDLNDFYAHFDDVERQIRMIAKGAELVRDAAIPGQSPFHQRPTLLRHVAG